MVHRTALVRACLVATVTASCMLPTDRSGTFTVVLQNLPTAVFVGDSLRIQATLLDPSGHAVPKVPWSLASSDPAVLEVVDPVGIIRARSVGTATLTVRALGYTDSLAFSQRVQVHAAVEIDSVAPSNVRFGDTLVIYGVGFSPGTIEAVGFGLVQAPIKTVISVIPGDSASRRGRVIVWVPVGAADTSAVTLIGTTGVISSRQKVVVQQHDLYEPNDTTYTDLGTLPNGFYNPELAFEARGRNDYQVNDWYLFRNTSPQTRSLATLAMPGYAYVALIDTIIKRYVQFDTLFVDPQTGDTLRFPRDSFLVEDHRQIGSLQQGYVSSQCANWGISGSTSSDTVTVSLANLRAGTYRIEATYYGPSRRAQGYALAISNQYVSDLPPDAAEGNDYCYAAAAVTVGAPPMQLSLDRPTDIDWFRFTLPTTQAVHLRTENAGEVDIDFQVFRDFLPDSISPVLYAYSGDPAVEDTTVTLSAGRYFVVVFSYLGKAVPYQFSVTPGVPRLVASLRSGASGPARSQRKLGRGHWVMRARSGHAPQFGGYVR